LCAAAAVAGAGCARWFPVPAQSAQEAPADLVLTGVEIRAYREGQLKAQGWASRALYRRHDGQAELERPRAHLTTGETAEAARAEWDGTAWSGGPVVLEDAGSRTEAPRFVAREGRVELTGGVRAELRR
jgi:hypothetical protein